MVWSAWWGCYLTGLTRFLIDINYAFQSSLHLNGRWWWQSSHGHDISVTVTTSLSLSERGEVRMWSQVMSPTPLTSSPPHCTDNCSLIPAPPTKCCHRKHQLSHLTRPRAPQARNEKYQMKLFQSNCLALAGLEIFGFSVFLEPSRAWNMLSIVSIRPSTASQVTLLTGGLRIII